MPKKVFIYCLKDPNTGDIRYIGQTGYLKKRLNQHIKASSKETTHLGNWLRSLKGERPVMVALHEVAEHESWAEEERRYIFLARGMGVNLVNATDGGEGTPNPTPETRAKMSAARRGVPLSPAARAALSATTRGVPKSLEHRAAMSAATKGVPKSPEARAKMSAAKRGVPRGPHSPEHCAAMRVPKWPGHGAAVSAALTGVPKSLEHCAAMSASRKGVPWTSAQRAAHEKGKLAKSAAK